MTNTGCGRRRAPKGKKGKKRGDRSKARKRLDLGGSDGEEVEDEEEEVVAMDAEAIKAKHPVRRRGARAFFRPALGRCSIMVMVVGWHVCEQEFEYREDERAHVWDEASDDYRTRSESATTTTPQQQAGHAPRHQLSGSPTTVWMTCAPSSSWCCWCRF